VEQWHEKLTALAETDLVSGLQAARRRGIRVGTAFSGCEMTWRVLEVLQKYWEKKYHVKIQVQLVFCCELEEQKAAWLCAEHPTCRYVFRNVLEMSRLRAFNWVSKGYDDVPHVDVWIGGFSCKDKSKLNVNRGQHSSCVQDGTGTTGSTFKFACDYLRANRPQAIVLENVPELANKAKGSEASDLDWVLAQLKEIGYCVSAHIYQACDHGSLAERSRVYIRGFMGPFESKLRHCHQVMNMVKIPQLPCEYFLVVRNFVRWMTSTRTGMPKVVAALRIPGGATSTFRPSERLN
jgi:site-specific DNA-cytosine methylase